MITLFVFLLISAFAAAIFLLGPGGAWVLGVGIFMVAWLYHLLVVVPRKPIKSRGYWAALACYMLIAGLMTSGVLVYLGASAITIELNAALLQPIAYAGTRLAALAGGAIIGLIVWLLFLMGVGYFSTIYVLAEHNDLPFWATFKSFFDLILNAQYIWQIVEDGQVTEVRKKGVDLGWFSLGKIIVRPGNAVILEKAGNITQICGPGIFVTGKNEKIRVNFDLRNQFYPQDVENVITADQIPLKVNIAVAYRLKRATDTATTTVLKEKKFGLFPVEEDTLLKAAFNGSKAGWHGFCQSFTVSLLRDQMMAHSLNDIFDIKGTDTSDPTFRANERRIKAIEDNIKNTMSEFGGNMGVDILGIDIREIHLPKDITEALHTKIKALAEADAIQHIEEKRNTARGAMITQILNSISTGTGRNIGDKELELAAIFAQMSRRALTDDILGHQYIEMLKSIAAGDSTKIFNASPSASMVDPEYMTRLAKPKNTDH